MVIGDFLILTDEEIRKRISEEKLVSGYIDLERQLQPHGFDLTVDKVFEFDSTGEIDFSNEKRTISDISQKEWTDGRTKLGEGEYKILTNETVSLSRDLAGLAQSRSSLLRCGCSVSHGLWDAGFEGKSEFLLRVGSEGLILHEDARISQIMFIKLSGTSGKEYSGVYGD